MGLPQSSTSPHLYSQALQLKLYQAFIFSIPILFSIILFLLFYLFYLKRRASTLSTSPSILARRSDIHQDAPYVSSVGLKGELKDKLPIVLFDEELRKRDSQCCVCLGDFEIKEELLQIPSCKHVFHIDCIHHWLQSNTSCPLCRCSVIPTATKLANPVPPPSESEPRPEPIIQPNVAVSNQSQQVVPQEQQQQVTSPSSMEGISPSSPMRSTIPRDCGSSSWFSSICRGNNEMGNYPEQESVIIHIQTHNS
ncbi:probable E3 ubiquitin-protein ligase RHA4A isoform X2 [Ziziphus jujuba]|uniref:RING-type E3 ubiquitin transferase n=1 Tax=Ziziphus jujuba TaxID=326968 RepID=A0A6P3YZQ3_ZIZJJ|nr:probable E3 ubiquitin-protein ligase RHA4A isoform X2 [Ziziphus jujuba]